MGPCGWEGDDASFVGFHSCCGRQGTEEDALPLSK